MAQSLRLRGVAFAAVAALVLSAAAPALAHHSFAMFDRNASRTLEGTVKSFAHVNPHGYLLVDVVAKSGKTQTWTIESPSIYAMSKEGIVGDTFKPGEKVSVTIHPLRNGTTGGQFVSATLADGRFVGEKSG